jgi:hypothetical protein
MHLLSLLARFLNGDLVFQIAGSWISLLWFALIVAASQMRGRGWRIAALILLLVGFVLAQAGAHWGIEAWQAWYNAPLAPHMPLEMGLLRQI